MKVAIEDVAKKLALWHTRTFRPILTHDELEPIMAVVGFEPLPIAAVPDGAIAWREYAFRLAPYRDSVPLPRLPHPRIDALHILAYRAFFDALHFYLDPEAVANIFHVRSMSIAHDRTFDRAYRPMKDCELNAAGTIFLYREGTLDHITKMASHQKSSNDDGDGYYNGIKNRKSPIIRKNSNNYSNPKIVTVPLKDLVSLG